MPETVNSVVNQTEHQVDRIAADLRLTGKVITANIIKERLKGNNNNLSLMELLSKHNGELAERVGIDYSSCTHKKYELTLRKVKEFIGIL